MAEKVGFVGLGAMGRPMAEHLLAAVPDLAVYNRTPGKSDSLSALGACLAPTAALAAPAGGILVTMLSDDDAVREVMNDGVLAALGPGGIHLSMSTIAPRTARGLSEAHKIRGVTYVAAPVFGRPEAAAAHKLWMTCSGPAKAKVRVRPLLEAMGQGIFDFGEDPGAAHAAKLAGNLMIASAVEALSEALVLARKQGVAPAAFHEMIVSTLFPGPVFQGYGRSMVEQRFDPPGFKLALALKDERLVLDAGGEAEAPLPLASLLRDRLLACAAKGRGGLDLAALYLEALDQAGLGEPSRTP